MRCMYVCYVMWVGAMCRVLFVKDVGPSLVQDGLDEEYIGVIECVVNVFGCYEISSFSNFIFNCFVAVVEQCQ